MYFGFFVVGGGILSYDFLFVMVRVVFVFIAGLRSIRYR